jgi:F-type H+-transporting ATPase subunit epsilon
VSTFHLTVSSPDGNKFDGEVFKFDVRGVEGELAIMAGHIPFITSVIKAPCTVWLDEDKKKTAVSDGGLLTVDTDRVTFISGSFEFTD